MSKSKHHNIYYNTYLAKFHHIDEITGRWYYIITIKSVDFIISGKDRDECKIVFHQIIDMISDKSTYINDIKRGMRYRLKMSISSLK